MFEQARFEHYIDRIRALGPVTTCIPKACRVAGDGDIEVYYAPFDYCNRDAQLVICGLTPGIQQAAIALNKARVLLLESQSHVLYRVKAQASFAGAMRSNLAAMLDYIGLPNLLAIDSSTQLFGTASNLVHYTSALRLPVFAHGKNYRGTPSPVTHPLLRKMVDTFLVEEVEALDRNAVWLPLGGAATESLRYLVDRGVLSTDQLLDGLPHPSGANAERIACFLDKKPVEKLSAKTNAVMIHDARDRLIAKIDTLSTRLGVDNGRPRATPASRAERTDADAKVKTAAIVTTIKATVCESSTRSTALMSCRRDGLPVLACDAALRSSPGADTETHVWVPVANDRTIFCSRLVQVKGGYRIGAKGEERRIDDLSRALDELRRMKVARWRRPSKSAGTPGIVSAVGWFAAPWDVFEGVKRVG